MMSPVSTPTKLEDLSLEEDQQGAATTPTTCATPRGYREIPLQITPCTWKTDLSKCNVCDDRFTWINHRHKCRHCCQAVCDSCSKTRKALRARTAPKRVCDACVRNCWTPRQAASKGKTLGICSTKPVDKGSDCLVSLTVSTSDAYSIDATATASLSPGTPAAVGFFGAGSVTPPATATLAEDKGAKNPETAVTTSTNNGDRDPDEKVPPSRGRRHHRRKVSIMLPPLPLASPGSAASALRILPPPTPAGDDEKDEAHEKENKAMSPSEPAIPSSASTAGRRGAAAGTGAKRVPFFGGRKKSKRRESTGGRLESSRCLITGSGSGALGAGEFLDRPVTELQQEQGQQKQQAKKALDDQQQRQRLAGLSEEPALDATAAGVEAESQEDKAAALKLPAWTGAVVGGVVAIGSVVAVTVLVRRAFSMVFFF